MPGTHVPRRTLLAGAASIGALTALPQPAHANPLPDGSARVNLLDRASHLLHRTAVPELFRAAPDVPSHSEVLVIGSGFGAAVAALRLGQAGAQVSMLERGSRWPRDPWRRIHAGDTVPDGRAFWHQRSFTGVTGIPVPSDNFGGVFDDVHYDNIRVWRGACVGGGSIVFTGVLLEPPKQYFEHVFGSTVSQPEMHKEWYPKARQMLKASPMPADIYRSSPFGHSRVWDEHARVAGYATERLDGIWDWDVVRAEIQGRSRKSAVIGESNYGNANGAKFDLTLNYLPQAEATGKVRIHHGHVVERIGRNAAGRYTVEVRVVTAAGDTVRRRTVTCARLVLGAGSVGTSELLVRAQAEGTLPRLDDSVGEGWGTNGDGGLVRSPALSAGLVQGSPSASSLLDDNDGLPTRLENWYSLGLQLNAATLPSLGMVMDPNRGTFRYDSTKDDVLLDFHVDGNLEAEKAMRRVHDTLAEANGVGTGFPLLGIPDVQTQFTAHPLGGAVLGQTTDGYGRVKGYEGLYVLDAAAIPGSTATANPTLTIVALAERNIARIIAEGR
ncbi:GMC oxidoreductase [Knoellia sp. S7-12]|uniref:GMC oxidoreductase n=1 Tax=Knoellia sp. S7-12 TaxID=3126698 RepID=UPI0033669374